MPEKFWWQALQKVRAYPHPLCASPSPQLDGIGAVLTDSVVVARRTGLSAELQRSHRQHGER